MVSTKLQSSFFDSRKVLRKTSTAERRVLSRFGAFVRRRARGSIRRRKKISAPGQTPSAHGKQIKQIFFAYNPANQNVVIGIEKRGKSNAPAALEHGEPSTTRIRGRKVRIRVRRRPIMGPALEHEKPKLDPLWRNSIRK